MPVSFCAAKTAGRRSTINVIRKVNIFGNELNPLFFQYSLYALILHRLTLLVSTPLDNRLTRMVPARADEVSRAF
jgi:hypothetical protein